MKRMTPEQLKADLEELLPQQKKNIEVTGTSGNLIGLVLSPD